MVKIGGQMAEPVSKFSGSQTLRPRARILRTLGDELISSETVAIVELVKNAYDADASRVLVRFEGPIGQETCQSEDARLDEPEMGGITAGMIEVLDNGHGMSLETLQTAWMEPATLFKKRQTKSQKHGRRVLGEKGIGRFAASRLADSLEVVTRQEGSDNEALVWFDWSQFDDENRFLDEIKLPWEQRPPEDICPCGAIQELWKEAGRELSPAELNHGTILRMKGLRTVWNKDQVEVLRNALYRLISPFFRKDRLAHSDPFEILLQLPPPLEPFSGRVEPPQALERPHYAIQGSIDTKGRHNLRLTLPGQEGYEELEGEFRLADGRASRCGPFDIELRVWDRDRLSMQELAHASDSTLKDVRRDLDEAAGINVYRDGFRTLPYGESGNDWLRLDARRIQNPTMRLSNNQIVGHVSISADVNPELRDQSNREGLTDGPALRDLRTLLGMSLAKLEERRYKIRHPKDTEGPSEKPDSLFVGFDLSDISSLIRMSHSDDEKLLALVDEKAAGLKKRVEKIQEILSRYRRLATLGQLIDTVLHDGRTPLTKIINVAWLGKGDVERAGSEPTVPEYRAFMQQLQGRFSSIITNSDILGTVFRRIEPLGGRKKGRPARNRLEKIIMDSFSVLDTEIARMGVRISFPGTDTQVTVDQAEIAEMMINLLQNSLYWLGSVPKDRRRVAVEVQRVSDGVQIIFSDSGPGVDPEIRERVFDPYFSTKPDGVGLGLTLAGEIVSDYYDGTLELLDSGPLPGATFRISLRRRV